MVGNTEGLILRPNKLKKSSHPNNIYSQTSLIRGFLIRMPDNPNTIPGNLNDYNDSVIRMFHNPTTL